MDPPTTLGPLGKNLMGGETEYTIIVRKGKLTFPEFFGNHTNSQLFFDRCVDPVLMPQNLLFRYPVHRFLGNGDRLLIDTGQRVEYATRESLGALSLLANEKVGDLVIENAVAQANEFWRDEGYSFRAYKSNLSRALPNSEELTAGGSHENYCIRTGEPIASLGAVSKSVMVLHLMTRFFSGNGWIDVDSKERKFRYFWSQRLLVTGDAISTASTAKRPLICLRDNEPLADITRFRRLHIICGDALLFDVARFLKYATTSRLAELLAAGYISKPLFGYYIPNHPVESLALHPVAVLATEFAKDTSLSSPVVVNGHEVTCVGVQEEIRELVGRFCERECDVNEEDRLMFEYWDKVIEAAKTPNPHEALSPYVDWAANKVWVCEDMERRGYGWNTPYKEVRRTHDEEGKREKAEYHVGELNLIFHELSPRGLARKLLDKPESNIVQLVSPAEVQTVYKVPKPDTRAFAHHLEMKAAKALAKKRKEKLVFDISHSTWSHTRVTIKDGPVILEYHDPDPFDLEPHKVTPSVTPEPPQNIYYG